MWKLSTPLAKRIRRFESRMCSVCSAVVLILSRKKERGREGERAGRETTQSVFVREASFTNQRFLSFCLLFGLLLDPAKPCLLLSVLCLPPLPPENPDSEWVYYLLYEARKSEGSKERRKSTRGEVSSALLFSSSSSFFGLLLCLREETCVRRPTAAGRSSVQDV